MNHAALEFLRRLPENEKEARSLVEMAFGIVDNVRGKIGDILKDSNLSPAGQQKRIADEIVRGGPLGHLKQLRSRAAAMTADAKNLRLAMQPPAPDRSDLHSELQRAELRNFVRSLPEGKRLRAVMEDAALTEAVLLAHPALSGLNTQVEDGAPSQFDLVKDHYVEAKFGPQLRGLEQREEVLENLNAAVAIATVQFCRESGLTEKEISE